MERFMETLVYFYAELCDGDYLWAWVVGLMSFSFLVGVSL